MVLRKSVDLMIVFIIFTGIIIGYDMTNDYAAHVQWLAIILPAFLISCQCGVLGPFIVIRRLNFLADTMAHGAILGIALGYLFGMSPTFVLIPFCILLGLCLTWVSRNRAEGLQSATAVSFAGSVGLGVLILSQLTKEDSHHVLDLLFGTLAKVHTSDLILMGVLGLPISAALVIFQKPLLITFLDERLAVAKGLSPGKIDSLFMVGAATIIAMTLKSVGVLLVMALIVIPSLVAGRLSKSFRQTLWMSPLICFLCCLLGLWASSTFKFPLGPSIATAATCFYLLSLILFPFKRA